MLTLSLSRFLLGVDCTETVCGQVAELDYQFKLSFIHLATKTHFEVDYAFVGDKWRQKTKCRFFVSICRAIFPHLETKFRQIQAWFHGNEWSLL